MFSVNKNAALIVAGAAGLLAARRYYRNWGSTKEESRVAMPGDGLIHGPVTETTAAEWIDAPADVVWSHVLDVGFGRHRPIDGDAPSIGDVVRFPVTIGGRELTGIAMSVVDVVDRRALVLRTLHPPLPVDVTCAWLAEPRWVDRTRLILRLRIALRHPGDVVVAEAIGPVVALLTRRALAAIRSSSVRADAGYFCDVAPIPR